MARLHNIKDQIKAVTGLTVFDVNEGVQVMVNGDHPELVPVIRAKLDQAGLRYSESRHRKFKGAFFTIPLRNAGTAWAADWEFA